MNPQTKKNVLFKPETIVIEREGGVATIYLNRPEVRNAINLQMISEMTDSFQMLNREEGIKIINLTSRGENFCSGADLNWMKEGINQSEKQLKKESLELARLFRTIWESHAITIASVKGNIPGGAIGLLAASDFVVAERSATLTFSEVKLGLVPATIAPYVLRKAGFSRSSDWMMTGRPIGVAEAREAGLLQRICEEGLLVKTTEHLIQELLSQSFKAVQGVKELLRRLEVESDPDLVDEYNSRLIASFRTSSDGQEGIKAFFEKRKPRWNEKS